jgi:hypothetical protein
VRPRTRNTWPSRIAPEHASGPYAAMIDDPDGNVVLLMSDNTIGA